MARQRVSQRIEGLLTGALPCPWPWALAAGVVAVNPITTLHTVLYEATGGAQWKELGERPGHGGLGMLGARSPGACAHFSLLCPTSLWGGNSATWGKDWGSSCTPNPHA